MQVFAATAKSYELSSTSATVEFGIEKNCLTYRAAGYGCRMSVKDRTVSPPARLSVNENFDGFQSTSINRDEKTEGGVRYFEDNEEAVCLFL